MPSLQITYCTPDKTDPDPTADLVGGPGWAMSKQLAIQLTMQNMTFFTMVNGVRAEVNLVQRGDGSLYLRTHRDASIANNLGEVTSTRNVMAKRLAEVLYPSRTRASGPPLAPVNGLLQRRS